MENVPTLVKRSLRRYATLGAAAVLFAGCAGSGAQNSFGLPAGAGLNPGNVMGGAAGGATLIRVRVPWTVGNAAPVPGATQPGAAAPMPLVPGTTPTPFATATPINVAPTPASGVPVQSLTLNLSGPTPATQTIGLTAGANQCVNAGSGTAVCQASLPLAAGNYTAAISEMGGVAPASGPQTIAFMVNAGSGTVVNLTLSGVPQQVAVLPGSSMSYVNAQGGIDAYGAGKHQLVAQLLDANQEIIVGPSAPVMSVSQNGGSLALAVTPPSPAVPNVFTVSPPLPYGGGTATLRVIAGFPGIASTLCSQIGAICTGNVVVDVKQLLAIANAGTNSVALYAGGQNVPVATIQNGVTNPQALVFDGAGDLFVASQTGNVNEYAAPYSGLPASIAIGINHPQALALDARGDLFVANGSGSNTVTEYAPPYGGGPVATISNGIGDPVSLGIDASGNLFVADQASNTVTQYAPPYAGVPTTLSTGLYGPNSLAIDGHGNLFVSNLNSTPASVVEFSPPFSSASAPVATITNGVNEQGAIAVGPSSSLFVPNQGSNTVTQYLPPYAGPPTSIGGGQNQPVALAVDAAGNLYVANYGNNSVTQYAPPYAGVSWVTYSNGVSSPQALALSPPTSTTALFP